MIGYRNLHDTEALKKPRDAFQSFDRFNLKRVTPQQGRSGPKRLARCYPDGRNSIPSTCIALNRHEHPADLYRTYPLLLSPASNSATCNTCALISWWITRTSEAPFTDASLVVFLRLQLTPADLRTPAEVHLYIYFLQPRFVSTSANDIQRSTLLRRQQPDVASASSLFMTLVWSNLPSHLLRLLMCNTHTNSESTHRPTRVQLCNHVTDQQ